MCAGACETQDGIRFSREGVMGSCEPPGLRASSPTLVHYNSSKHSQVLSHCSTL